MGWGKKEFLGTVVNNIISDRRSVKLGVYEFQSTPSNWKNFPIIQGRKKVWVSSNKKKSCFDKKMRWLNIVQRSSKSN